MPQKREKRLSNHCARKSTLESSCFARLVRSGNFTGRVLSRMRKMSAKIGNLSKREHSKLLRKGRLIDGRNKTINNRRCTALQEISIETYTDTFGPYNTPENMQAYLVEAYNLEKLQRNWLIPTLTFILSLSIIN